MLTNEHWTEISNAFYGQIYPKVLESEAYKNFPQEWKVSLEFMDYPPRIEINVKIRVTDNKRAILNEAESFAKNLTDDEMIQIAAWVIGLTDDPRVTFKRKFYHMGGMSYVIKPKEYRSFLGSAQTQTAS